MKEKLTKLTVSGRAVHNQIFRNLPFRKLVGRNCRKRDGLSIESLHTSYLVTHYVYGVQLLFEK